MSRKYKRVAGEYGPGLVALRDTPVTPQAGLRAREWMLTHPHESPSHAFISCTVADDSFFSLTVAGAAPELPCPVRHGAPASRFTPE